MDTQPRGALAATRKLVPDLQVRQIEFGLTEATSRFIAAGTLDGTVALLSHGAGAGYVVGAAREVGFKDYDRDTILGLCWFRQEAHAGRLLSGSAGGEIIALDCSDAIASWDDEAAAAHAQAHPLLLPRHPQYRTAYVDVPVIPVVGKLSNGFRDMTCVHINKNDTLALASGYSSDLHLWDLGTGKKLSTFQNAHVGHINISRFANNSPFIVATSSFDGTIRVWDTRTTWTGREPQPVYTVATSRGVVTLSFSPDDAYLLGCAGDNDMRVYSMATGKHYVTLDVEHTGRSDNYTRGYFADGGAVIVSGSSEECVLRTHAASTGEQLSVVELYDGRPNNSLYVQSLRGHPHQVGYRAVLTNSRSGSDPLSLVIVEPPAIPGVEGVGRGGAAAGTPAVEAPAAAPAPAPLPWQAAAPREATGTLAGGPLSHEFLATMWRLLSAAQRDGAAAAAPGSYAAIVSVGAAAPGAGPSIGHILRSDAASTLPASLGPSGADVTILAPSACGSFAVRYSAHRAVLRARVPFFRAVFDALDSCALPPGPVLLSLPATWGLTPAALATLLLFAYTDRFVPSCTAASQVETAGAPGAASADAAVAGGVYEAGHVALSPCGGGDSCAVCGSCAATLQASVHGGTFEDPWQAAAASGLVGYSEGPLVLLGGDANGTGFETGAAAPTLPSLLAAQALCPWDLLGRWDDTYGFTAVLNIEERELQAKATPEAAQAARRGRRRRPVCFTGDEEGLAVGNTRAVYEGLLSRSATEWLPSPAAAAADSSVAAALSVEEEGSSSGEAAVSGGSVASASPASSQPGLAWLGGTASLASLDDGTLFTPQQLRPDVRHARLLSAVQAGFDAARIGGLPRLADLVVTRVVVGRHGASELRGATLEPLVAIALRAGAVWPQHAVPPPEVAAELAAARAARLPAPFVDALAAKLLLVRTPAAGRQLVEDARRSGTDAASTGAAATVLLAACLQHALNNGGLQEAATGAVDTPFQAPATVAAGSAPVAPSFPAPPAPPRSAVASAALLPSLAHRVAYLRQLCAVDLLVDTHRLRSRGDGDLQRWSIASRMLGSTDAKHFVSAAAYVRLVPPVLPALVDYVRRRMPHAIVPVLNAALARALTERPFDPGALIRDVLLGYLPPVVFSPKPRIGASLQPSSVPHGPVPFGSVFLDHALAFAGYGMGPNGADEGVPTLPQGASSWQPEGTALLRPLGPAVQRHPPRGLRELCRLLDVPFPAHVGSYEPSRSAIDALWARAKELWQADAVAGLTHGVTNPTDGQGSGDGRPSEVPFPVFLKAMTEVVSVQERNALARRLVLTYTPRTDPINGVLAMPWVPRVFSHHAVLVATPGAGKGTRQAMLVVGGQAPEVGTLQTLPRHMLELDAGAGPAAAAQPASTLPGYVSDTTGVWRTRDVRGIGPIFSMNHMVTGLDGPGGRYVLVYPGSRAAGAMRGPGSAAWLAPPRLSTGDDSSDEEERAESSSSDDGEGELDTEDLNHLDHVLGSGPRPLGSRRRRLAAKAAKAATAAGPRSRLPELPPYGALNDVQRKAIEDAVVYVYDSVEGEWHTITPAWPERWEAYAAAAAAEKAEAGLGSIARPHGSTPLTATPVPVTAATLQNWEEPLLAAAPGALQTLAAEVEPGAVVTRLHAVLFGGHLAGRNDGAASRQLAVLETTITRRQQRASASPSSIPLDFSFKWTTPTVHGLQQPPPTYFAASAMVGLPREEGGPVMLLNGGIAGRNMSELFWVLAESQDWSGSGGSSDAGASASGASATAAAALAGLRSRRGPRLPAYSWHRPVTHGALPSPLTQHTMTPLSALLPLVSVPAPSSSSLPSPLAAAFSGMLSDIARRTVVVFGGTGSHGSASQIHLVTLVRAPAVNPITAGGAHEYVLRVSTPRVEGIPPPPRAAHSTLLAPHWARFAPVTDAAGVPLPPVGVFDAGAYTTCVAGTAAAGTLASPVDDPAKVVGRLSATLPGALLVFGGRDMREHERLRYLTETSAMEQVQDGTASRAMYDAFDHAIDVDAQLRETRNPFAGERDGRGAFDAPGRARRRRRGNRRMGEGGHEEEEENGLTLEPLESLLAPTPVLESAATDDEDAPPPPPARRVADDVDVYGELVESGSGEEDEEEDEDEEDVWWGEGEEDHDEEDGDGEETEDEDDAMVGGRQAQPLAQPQLRAPLPPESERMLGLFRSMEPPEAAAGRQGGGVLPPVNPVDTARRRLEALPGGDWAHFDAVAAELARSSYDTAPGPRHDAAKRLAHARKRELLGDNSYAVDSNVYAAQLIVAPFLAHVARGGRYADVGAAVVAAAAAEERAAPDDVLAEWADLCSSQATVDLSLDNTSAAARLARLMAGMRSQAWRAALEGGCSYDAALKLVAVVRWQPHVVTKRVDSGPVVLPPLSPPTLPLDFMSLVPAAHAAAAAAVAAVVEPPVTVAPPPASSSSSAPPPHADFTLDVPEEVPEEEEEEAMTTPLSSPSLPTALSTYTWLLRARSPAFAIMLQSDATAAMFGPTGGLLGASSPLAAPLRVSAAEIARVVARAAGGAAATAGVGAAALGFDPVAPLGSAPLVPLPSSPSSSHVFDEARRGRFSLFGSHVNPRVGIGFLHYLATDTLPPALSPQEGMALMLLAVEFSVPRLARLVEAELIRVLDTDNVVDLLNFADTFSGSAARRSSASHSGDGPSVQEPRVFLRPFADPRIQDETSASRSASGGASQTETPSTRVLRTSVGPLPFAGLRAAGISLLLRLGFAFIESPAAEHLSPSVRQELTDTRLSGKDVYGRGGHWER